MTRNILEDSKVQFATFGPSWYKLVHELQNFLSCFGGHFVLCGYLRQIWKECDQSAVDANLSCVRCNVNVSLLTLHLQTKVIYMDDLVLRPSETSIFTGLFTAWTVQPSFHQGSSFPTVGMESHTGSPTRKYAVLCSILLFLLSFG